MIKQDQFKISPAQT
jgi:hypothetical protein